MNMRAWSLATAAAFAAALAFAAAGPPLAGVWNIAPTGRADSSGGLHFRITQNDGSDPVDITVPVIMGAKEDTIARAIKNSLGSQLRRDLYKVELGQGANVMVSDPRGRPNFSLELIDSDIDNLRVAVQSVAPTAPPTVPTQSAPAEPAINPPPPNMEPGNAAPPPDKAIPVPAPDMPVPNPTAPPAPSPGIPVPSPNTPRLPAPPPAPPGTAPPENGALPAPPPENPPAPTASAPPTR